MPLNLDIRDLLRTGQLGPVTLGHTRREVHDLLGPPDDWSSTPHMFARKATTWLYGPIELFFAPGPTGEMSLHTLWCDYIPFLEARMRDGGSLRLSPWIFAGAQPVSQAQLERALRSQSLRYRVQETPVADQPHLQVVLESGVVFGVNDEGEGPVVAYLQVRDVVP